MSKRSKLKNLYYKETGKYWKVMGTTDEPNIEYTKWLEDKIIKEQKTNSDESRFIFTPENLIENIEKLGAWSSYGLAIEALKYYFPDEYDEYDYCDISIECELLGKLDCNSWQDVVIKYHKEVGYTVFNQNVVNEY